MKIVVIHGPNLNLLGTREPEVYGSRTLADLDRGIVDHATSRGVEVETFQSNQEGDIVDRIQRAASEGADAIVINPGAYTHTSLAIADALQGVAVPAIEVHISNIHGREPERSRSLTAGACHGIVSGLGFDSYLLGIDAALAVSKR
jgi:3-dehydroquinate dehydratase-2